MCLKELTTGRTKPLLVLARDPEEKARRVVLKARGDEWPAEFLVEWVSSWIGRALGLHCAEIVALSVTVSFLATLRNELQDRMAKSSGLVAGSVWLEGLMQIPKGKLSKSQQDEAQRVLGFDVYTHNPDRRRDNPNLGYHAQHFGLYDHELALGFRKPGMLIGSVPESDPCLGIVRDHCLFSGLKAKKNVSMERFQDSLHGLTDEWFDELAAAAPRQWLTNGCQEQLSTIIKILRKRRDCAAGWLEEVRTCLA